MQHAIDIEPNGSRSSDPGNTGPDRGLTKNGAGGLSRENSQGQPKPMNMGKPTPAISVAVLENTAFIKISGRANFNSSVDFKRLVHELRQKGLNRFMLDLGDCVTMDSTFLGVLAGIALRDIDGRESDPSGPRVHMDLLNPNPRITELLENLGVIHLFNLLHQPTPCTVMFQPQESGAPPSKAELSRHCLEAHVTLMDINPDNIPKFKDVAQFFEQDLK